MTDVTATIGPRLKAERERRGLSAQKAADELHLDGWVINALEAEDYGRVGPSVYAKGHLKRYAALLGLPPDEIVAGYESSAQAPKPSAAQLANVRLRTDEPAVNNLPWPQIAGSIGVVLLILGVLWWRPWHSRSATPVNAAPLAVHPNAAPRVPDSTADMVATAAAPPTMRPPQSQSQSQSPPPASPSPAPAASTQPPSPSGAAAAMPVAATASSNTDSTAGAGRARLRMSFSADSWVDVHDAAGRRAFAGNGRANSVKTVAGIAPMRVYLGFASGVQLEINNRAVAIGPQFVAGDVARFEAGADGVLRRDSHSAAAPGAAIPAAAAPSGQARGARPTG
jgi:cytoskeleton protein RodZ